jgi:hypothetical protein
MRGLEKLREKVKGKVLYRNRETGEIKITKDRRERKEEREESIELDSITVLEDEVAIEVEMREDRDGGESTRSSVLSTGGRSVDGYNFLELMEEEGEDEKEKEKREQRKRKRVEEIRIEIKQAGMKNVPGWEQRSQKERGDEKWKI